MAYRTAEGAKRKAPHHSLLPTLVRLPNGMYETFPYGCPIPAGATILARKFSPAMGGWIKPNVVTTVPGNRAQRVEVNGDTFEVSL